MRMSIWQKIREFLREAQFRRRLTKVVAFFAAITVFVTTYILILPAITLEDPELVAREKWEKRVQFNSSQKLPAAGETPAEEGGAGTNSGNNTNSGSADSSGKEGADADNKTPDPAPETTPNAPETPADPPVDSSLPPPPENTETTVNGPSDDSAGSIETSKAENATPASDLPPAPQGTSYQLDENGEPQRDASGNPILLDVASGLPVQTDASGNPQKDDKQHFILLDPTTGLRIYTDATGAPQQDASGRYLLANEQGVRIQTDAAGLPSKDADGNYILLDADGKPLDAAKKKAPLRASSSDPAADAGRITIYRDSTDLDRSAFVELYTGTYYDNANYLPKTAADYQTDPIAAYTYPTGFLAQTTVSLHTQADQAITENGGSYFRLYWRFAPPDGLSAEQLQSYYPTRATRNEDGYLIIPKQDGKVDYSKWYSQSNFEDGDTLYFYDSEGNSTAGPFIVHTVTDPTTHNILNYVDIDGVSTAEGNFQIKYMFPSPQTGGGTIEIWGEWLDTITSPETTKLTGEQVTAQKLLDGTSPGQKLTYEVRPKEWSIQKSGNTYTLESKVNPSDTYYWLSSFTYNFTFSRDEDNISSNLDYPNGLGVNAYTYSDDAPLVETIHLPHYVHPKQEFLNAIKQSANFVTIFPFGRDFDDTTKAESWYWTIIRIGGKLISQDQALSEYDLIYKYNYSHRPEYRSNYYYIQGNNRDDREILPFLHIESQKFANKFTLYSKNGVAPVSYDEASNSLTIRWQWWNPSNLDTLVESPEDFGLSSIRFAHQLFYVNDSDRPAFIQQQADEKAITNTIQANTSYRWPYTTSGSNVQARTLEATGDVDYAAGQNKLEVFKSCVENTDSSYFKKTSSAKVAFGSTDLAYVIDFRSSGEEAYQNLEKFEDPLSGYFYLSPANIVQLYAWTRNEKNLVFPSVTLTNVGLSRTIDAQNMVYTNGETIQNLDEQVFGYQPSHVYVANEGNDSAGTLLGSNARIEYSLKNLNPRTLQVSLYDGTTLIKQTDVDLSEIQNLEYNINYSPASRYPQANDAVDQIRYFLADFSYNDGTYSAIILPKTETKLTWDFSSNAYSPFDTNIPGTQEISCHIPITVKSTYLFAGQDYPRFFQLGGSFNSVDVKNQAYATLKEDDPVSANVQSNPRRIDALLAPNLQTETKKYTKVTLDVDDEVELKMNPALDGVSDGQTLIVLPQTASYKSHFRDSHSDPRQFPMVLNLDGQRLLLEESAIDTYNKAHPEQHLSKSAPVTVEGTTYYALTEAGNYNGVPLRSKKNEIVYTNISYAEADGRAQTVVYAIWDDTLRPGHVDWWKSSETDNISLHFYTVPLAAGNTTVFLGDHQSHRIVATQNTGYLVVHEKTILDNQAIIDEDAANDPIIGDFSTISQGESVLYRFEFSNRGTQAVSVYSSSTGEDGTFYQDVYDLLPSGVNWVIGQNVHYKGIAYSSAGIGQGYFEEDKADITVNTSSTGKQEYKLTWKDTLEQPLLHFNGYGSIYVYYQLDFPQEDADWENFRKETDHRNRLYLYREPQEVIHELDSPLKAVFQKSVVRSFVQTGISGGDSKESDKATFSNGGINNQGVLAYALFIKNTGERRLYLGPIYDNLPSGVGVNDIDEHATSGAIYDSEGISRYRFPVKIEAKKRGSASDPELKLVYTITEVAERSTYFDEWNPSASTNGFLRSHVDNEGRYYLLPGEYLMINVLIEGVMPDYKKSDDTISNKIAMPLYDDAKQPCRPINEADLSGDNSFDPDYWKDSDTVYAQQNYNYADQGRGTMAVKTPSEARDEGFTDANYPTEYWLFSDISSSRHVTPGLDKTLHSSSTTAGNSFDPRDAIAFDIVPKLDSQGGTIHNPIFVDHFDNHFDIKTLQMTVKHPGLREKGLEASILGDEFQVKYAKSTDPINFTIDREANTISYSYRGTQHVQTLDGEETSLWGLAVKKVGDNDFATSLVKIPFYLSFYRETGTNGQIYMQIRLGDEQNPVDINYMDKFKISVTYQNPDATLPLDSYSNVAEMILQQTDLDDTVNSGYYVDRQSANPALQLQKNSSQSPLQTLSAEQTAVRDSEQVYFSGTYAIHSDKAIGISANTFTSSNSSADPYLAAGSLSGQAAVPVALVKSTDNVPVLSLPSAQTRVTYQLIVDVSQQSSELSDLVIIDTLPALNDKELVSERSRESAFQLNFAAHPVVQIKNQNGEDISNKFILEFAKVSDYTSSGSYTNAWDPTVDGSDLYASADYVSLQNTEGGNSILEKTSTAASTDFSEGYRSFRLRLKDGETIPRSSQVVVYFDAYVDASTVMTAETQKAWNSFGYSYVLANGMSAGKPYYKLAPLKVGVEIPPAPTLTKKLVDANGKPIAAKRDSTYAFVLIDAQNGPSVEPSVTEEIFQILQDAEYSGNDISGLSGLLNSLIAKADTQQIAMEVFAVKVPAGSSEYTIPLTKEAAVLASNNNTTFDMTSGHRYMLAEICREAPKNVKDNTAVKAADGLLRYACQFVLNADGTAITGVDNSSGRATSDPFYGTGDGIFVRYDADGTAAPEASSTDIRSTGHHLPKLNSGDDGFNFLTFEYSNGATGGGSSGSSGGPLRSAPTAPGVSVSKNITVVNKIMPWDIQILKTTDAGGETVLYMPKPLDGAVFAIWSPNSKDELSEDSKRAYRDANGILDGQFFKAKTESYTTPSGETKTRLFYFAGVSDGQNLPSSKAQYQQISSPDQLTSVPYYLLPTYASSAIAYAKAPFTHTFGNLYEDVYLVQEIKAPKGFAKVDKAFVLQKGDKQVVSPAGSGTTISTGVWAGANGADYETYGGVSSPDPVFTVATYTSRDDAWLVLPNVPASREVLPATGGGGTQRYMLAGLLLMLGAAIAYRLVNHRKERRSST